MYHIVLCVLKYAKCDLGIQLATIDDRRLLQGRSHRVVIAAKRRYSRARQEQDRRVRGRPVFIIMELLCTLSWNP